MLCGCESKGDDELARGFHIGRRYRDRASVATSPPLVTDEHCYNLCASLRCAQRRDHRRCGRGRTRCAPLLAVQPPYRQGVGKSGSGGEHTTTPDELASSRGGDEAPTRTKTW